MSVRVVDTNVAIVANTRDTHADVACQLTCIDKLSRLVREGVVAVDETGFILRARSLKYHENQCAL